MTDEPMVTRTVRATWRSTDRIEVPASVADLPLMDWPEEYLDQVTSQTAELVDWDVT